MPHALIHKVELYRSSHWSSPDTATPVEWHVTLIGEFLATHVLPHVTGGPASQATGWIGSYSGHVSDVEDVSV